MQFRRTASCAMATILLLGAFVPGASGPAAAHSSDTGAAMALTDKSFIAQAKPARGTTARDAARTLISEPVIASRAPNATPRHAGLDVSARDLAAGLQRAWSDFKIWLRQTYARQPVVAIALVALLLLPFLAVPGLLGRRKKPERAYTGEEQSNFLRADWAAPLLSGPAWIRIEGEAGKAMRISGEMLRIGRESDNDVCLADRSVHRYHALIHRTPDAEFCVTDLSGDSGNGMFVNGVKLRAAILGSGDLIQLGMVGVRFEQGQA